MYQGSFSDVHSTQVILIIGTGCLEGKSKQVLNLTLNMRNFPHLNMFSLLARHQTYNDVVIPYLFITLATEFAPA